MIDARIKFRHLQCFLEIARQGSISRAAEALAISQPAVSKTLKELEDILAIRLFERSRKGIRLTRFGEVFLRHASASVMALQEGMESVSAARSRGGHAVAVGVLPNVGARMMPRALSGFHKAAPQTLVRVSTGSNAHLLDDLKRGAMDLVVGRLVDPADMVGLSFEHLYSEPLTLVVRAGHPIARQTAFDISEIEAYPISLPTAGTVIRNDIDRYLIANGVRLVGERVETISVTFGRSHVLASDTVWAVPRGAVLDDLAAGLLAELPIDRTPLMGAIGLTTRSDVAPTPLTSLLIATIRDAAAEIRAEEAGEVMV
ncbi:pca operon transcription factor PcaQ [Breoghania sp.]|uniref:pca operon transcription factor PcaQ n=1 Tax=Breoghania sp. TaxID=2065378 RepID=UPI002AAC349C|nr:pca operon transcription factor PcaQ [Breoghania sp.]